MATKSKTHFVPPIGKSLLKRLQTPDNWMLDLATENIDRFNKLLASLPRNYTWRYMTAEAFKKNADSLGTGKASDLYRHYWHDMLRQIDAFSVMSAWRLAEIVRSAIWAIRRDDVVCAAIMSRAALETAASYAWFQTEIRPALEQIGQGDTPTLVKYLEQGVVKDLEDKLLKVVFASKLKDADTFYNPTNIVTIIDHIVKKIPDQQAVAGIYSTLCEVAHPNMLGRSLYITKVETVDIPGHENRTISMNHGSATIGILRDSISALSWSSATFALSCVALQDSVRKMLSHVDRVSA